MSSVAQHLSKDRPVPSLLGGKNILVTGAASGIGLASAQIFAHAGARVFTADRNVEQLAQCVGIDATLTAELDVTNEAQCIAVVARAVDRLGHIDGVLNTAGISDPVQPAIEIDIDAWQRVVDVHLRGSFLIARTVGRHMLDRGCGSIVQISSVNGLSGIPRRHGYGPAKAAIAQLTRTLACEWGHRNVRVNAIAPTYIRTPMIDRLADEGKIDLARLEARTPMGRIGEPGDVALAATFLLSDLSQYITGTVLPVDGGWTAYGGPGDVRTA